MAVGGMPPAHAALLCAADLNGNGDAADAGEMAQCLATADGGSLCPIGKVDCVADSSGAYGCPLGAAYACLTPSGGGVPACSPHSCIDTSVTPIETEEPVDDPGAPGSSTGSSVSIGVTLVSMQLWGEQAGTPPPDGVRQA